MEKGPLIGRGRTAEVYAWGESEAIKLYYPTVSANFIKEEMRINLELLKAGLPVMHIGEMVELDGRQGFICEKIDGGSMLQNMLHHPWRLSHYARQLAELQIAMHQRQVAGLEPWKDRLIRYISQQDLLTEEKQKQVIAYLEGLPAGDTLCHGDFHPDNVLLSSRGPVIIDWMTAVSAHPLADVARTSLLLQYGISPHSFVVQKLAQTFAGSFHHFYLKHYLKLANIPVEAIRAWYAPIAAARLVEGVPLEEKRVLVEMIDRWSFEI